MCIRDSINAEYMGMSINYSAPKKIQDLEQQIESLQNDLNSNQFIRPNIGQNQDLSLLFPRAPCKQTLQGHRGAITMVRLHPAYSLLASSSEDGTIKLWDLETGQFERSLKGHTQSVICIAFHSKGEQLISGSADLTIKIWELSGFQCIRTLYGHEHSISHVEFVGNGDRIISASRDCNIRIWEIGTGFCLHTIHGHDEWIRRCIVDGEEKLMASCSNDQMIRIWDLKKLEIVNELSQVSFVLIVVLKVIILQVDMNMLWNALYLFKMKTEKKLSWKVTIIRNFQKALNKQQRKKKIILLIITQMIQILYSIK
eukprot:TRINITY_DN14609_c0_g1_i4.p1 TRINITY_DN14609_c0_g1~~TRINITY_DN14609_c0_g1_i4.p1  ORF type:complete len:313 (-),score=17.68 TRINITY_DN14609_c0_g1_i4:477-1415(-)